MHLFVKFVLLPLCTVSFCGQPLSTLADQGFIISQTGKSFSFDTRTGIATKQGVSKRGLNAFSRKGAFEFVSYWELGSFRPTIMFGGKKIISGNSSGDVSRVGGFRYDRAGSYVYIRTSKGPKARVELVQDGRVVLDWPRLTFVNILAFEPKVLTISIFEKHSRTTRFYRYARNADGWITTDRSLVGEYEGCAVLSAKVFTQRIILQVYCEPRRGSDLVALDTATRQFTTLLASEADEIIATLLVRKKGKFSVLSITGNRNGRMAFHATTGILMRGLGEPISYASDAAGKQSWTQSYRTLTLATLFQKVRHPVFASLARHAMRNTLANRNYDLGVSGAYNPPCAWSSRIYSTDHRSPVSFLINQAMISGSLLRSCEMLGVQCPADLRRRIVRNAACLVRSYEPTFDIKTKLYRIQYGAPFRYDGIWAPWNWHLTWAVILDRVGSSVGNNALRHRARVIAQNFLASWTLNEKGALWRYWVPRYYGGWQEADKISMHRPRQRADQNPKRYEDVNHAGLSLLGLAALDLNINPRIKKSIKITLDRLLDEGSILPRDLDGRGPRTPRWLPGAGWDAFATDKMRERYSRLVPGGGSGHQLLAYATLIDPNAKFDLKLKLHECSGTECVQTRAWNYTRLDRYLSANPLFSISRMPGL